MESPRFFSLSVEHWPRVDVHFTCKPSTVDDVDVFGDELEHVLRRAAADDIKIDLFMLLDGLLDADWALKLRAVAVIGRLRELARVAVRATALVVASPAVRAIIDFILKLAPLQSVHAIFETQEQALEWLS